MADRFDIAVMCSLGIGPQRGGRQWNEDNYVICLDGRARWRDRGAESSEPVESAGALLAVADGMGGHTRGDIASEAAVRALVRLVRAGEPEDPEDALRRFVLHAHGRLFDQAAAQGAGSMGTTLTAMWILNGVAHWVHVGDSRLYLLRGEDLAQMTADHTRGEFARRDGRPPPRDPGALVQGFVFGSRGLGDDRNLRLDPGKDTGRIPLWKGDRLLLCSDGLHGAVRREDLAQILREAPDAASAASTLVHTAIANGSDDNITALVVEALEVARPSADTGPLVDVATLVPME